MERLFRSRKKRSATNFLMENNRLFLKELIKSFDGKRNPIHLFSEKELAKATCNYDPELILYDEGFYNLYKGNYDTTRDRIIVVQKFRGNTKKIIIQELVVLSQINHKNVVKLLGCCLETEFPILVYEYCHANGTLYDRIFHEEVGVWRPPPLSWESRLRIATEIADAITYMHIFTSRPIIHRDIKLSNIILDDQDVARLFHFSLCIRIPFGQTHVEDGIYGTFGYLDPEYAVTSRVSEKADVYGFGIVLLEILTGQRITDVRGSENAHYFTHVESLIEEGKPLGQIVDPKIQEGGEEVNDQQLHAYVNIAMRCTVRNEDERPAMVEVAKELKRIWMVSHVLPQ